MPPMPTHLRAAPTVSKGDPEPRVEDPVCGLSAGCLWRGWMQRIRSTPSLTGSFSRQGPTRMGSCMDRCQGI